MSRSKAKSSLWELSSHPKAPLPVLLLAGLILCALAGFWQYRAAGPENTASEVSDRTAVRINELMSSNKSAVLDDRGAYSDWIELLNASDQPADITGWKLSDGGSIFTFPGHVLAPGEAVVVYASGSIHAISGEAYHAPFRLSASGETLTLTDAFERPVDTVELPPLAADTSYIRVEDAAWTETLSFTPGLANDQPYAVLEEASPNSGLIISEVMPKNASYAADMDGDFSDYIELYNATGSTISLKGFMLSDDAARRQKWLFPDVSIGAGQYLIVYASGKDRTDGELHTNFGLDADGEAIILSDSRGRLLSKMSYQAAESDVSWSFKDNVWTVSIPPTPSFSNDNNGAAQLDSILRAQNTDQIFINEVMSSTRLIDDETEFSYDWLELHNASSKLVDLSGWGLSDSSAHPRKWQFPQGTTIGPNQYLVVQLSGRNSVEHGIYHASFSLSRSKSESVTLCRPDGTIVDRTPMAQQYAEISYGRKSAQSGFFLFTNPTPGAANNSEAYFGRTQPVVFSEEGGQKDGPFTLTLSAEEGAVIYYTTDCTEPTTASARYTGPLQISSTTVVRAIACHTGYIDSLSSARTYLIGTNHALPVVSMVADPDDMFGDRNGIYTNSDEQWERGAHIEFYTAEGKSLFAQGAAVSLHGNDARKLDQKTFNVIARSEYGDNRFRAAIFPNRDYTEYQSFLLRPSSEDGTYTRLRCSILSTLLDETTVMHQDTVVAVLYINGEYWGHYNLRERTNAHAIAQWEGWTDPSRISIVKSNNTVMQGSDKAYKALLAWLKDHPLTDPENMAYVRSQVDVENYLDYVMLQIYVSNSDLANVKRYRSDEGDGKWRWIVFDLDWAFHNDTNSWADWIGFDGRAPRDGTDTSLFRALMKDPETKDYFLRLMGQRMATTWSANAIIEKIDARIPLIEPELAATYAKFEGSVERWTEKIASFKAYTRTRAVKLIGYIAGCEDLSDAEIEEYFGEALRVNSAS